MLPAFVGISHGTSSAAGQAVVQRLVTDVSQALDDRSQLPEVRLGHVDVQQPDVPATLESLPQDLPAVIIPLLLSAGFHVNVDLTEAVAEKLDAPRTIQMSAALGPDERLADLLTQRLHQVGADPSTDTIVLAAAGSSDSSAIRDCQSVTADLSKRLGVDVTSSFLSFAHPGVAEAVADARRRHPERRVVVASYLLAPGYFHGLLTDVGADLVTAPLLSDAEPTAPTQLVEIVVDRYLQTADHAAAA